jgi:hypothetical protein
LLTVDETTVLDTVGAQVPEWNTVLVVVNSTVYGGSGGAVGPSRSTRAAEIALHELGHTAFGLADEYEYFRGCASGETDRNKHPAVEPAEVNVTINTDRATLKWGHLVAATTPIPTTSNADCTQCDPQASPVSAGTVGLFEGAHYYHCGAFRPEFNCRMRALGNPFCAVCQERIRAILGPYLTLTITWSAPENISVKNPAMALCEVRSRVASRTLLCVLYTQEITIIPTVISGKKANGGNGSSEVRSRGRCHKAMSAPSI